MSSKFLYIKTYGCQMNVYDSLKITNLLKPHGFTLTQDKKNADLVVLNTCHVRHKASEKIYSELGAVNNNNYNNVDKKQVIIVAGCTAQAEGKLIFQRAANVNIVVGPQSYHHLPRLLERVKRKEKWIINLSFNEQSKFDKINLKHNPGFSSFITIQEGCDKFCHFCCVPYTRGREYSRSVMDVYKESTLLVEKGVKEIILLGQNVSAFHNNGQSIKNLACLMHKMCQINKLIRIRYITSHPKDMINNKLFMLHAKEKKIMPLLHLPIQSGSNKILQSMNRGHSRDFYLRIIDKFKKYRANIAFSSDFIVGYPGESDKDFKDSVNLIKEVKYAQSYSFKYSPRPGTPASIINDQIPEKVKLERLSLLQDLLRNQQLEFNKQCIKKDTDILFSKLKKCNKQIIGKSPYLQSVIVRGNSSMIGKIQKVRIIKIGLQSLIGVIKE